LSIGLRAGLMRPKKRTNHWRPAVIGRCTTCRFPDLNQVLVDRGEVLSPKREQFVFFFVFLEKVYCSL